MLDANITETEEVDALEAWCDLFLLKRKNRTKTI